MAVEGVPAPIGLYSHAVAAPPGACVVAVAGQVAVNSEGEPFAGSFEGQMRAALGSLETILADGGGLKSVLKFTTYLVRAEDISLFYAERARLWPAYFPDGRYPANTLLVVQRLVRPEFLIEIEALAIVSQSMRESS